MSDNESLGEQLGEGIVIKALREIFVEAPDKRRELRKQIEKLEKEKPQTIEAFEEREAKIAELMKELHALST